MDKKWEEQIDGITHCIALHNAKPKPPLMRRSEEQQSAAQHERELEIQRMKENMKAETARAEALARAEAERMNEDVKLRMMKAEAEQRRIRNVAAVKEGFEWIGKGINQVRMEGNQSAARVKH